MTVLVFAMAVLAAPDDPAGTGWDVFATIYVVGFGALVALIGYLFPKLDSWLKEKAKTERWVGFVRRFVGRVRSGGVAIGSEWQRLLEQAQGSDSPGGRTITEDELATARQNLWDYVVDAYGNWEALEREIKAVAGGNPDTFMAAHIDAELVRQKRAAESGGATDPAKP